MERYLNVFLNLKRHVSRITTFAYHNAVHIILWRDWLGLCFWEFIFTFKFNEWCIECNFIFFFLTYSLYLSLTILFFALYVAYDCWNALVWDLEELFVHWDIQDYWSTDSVCFWHCPLLIVYENQSCMTALAVLHRNFQIYWPFDRAAILLMGLLLNLSTKLIRIESQSLKCMDYLSSGPIVCEWFSSSGCY